MNTYEYLNKHFPLFYQSVVGNSKDMANGIIVCDGDKFQQYESEWKKHGISLEHGAMIYLISKDSPFSSECRQTVNGFVPVEQWVIDNYKRFATAIRIVEAYVFREDLKANCTKSELQVITNIMAGYYTYVEEPINIAIDDVKFLDEMGN